MFRKNFRPLPCRNVKLASNKNHIEWESFKKQLTVIGNKHAATLDTLNSNAFELMNETLPELAVSTGEARKTNPDLQLDETVSSDNSNQIIYNKFSVIVAKLDIEIKRKFQNLKQPSRTDTADNSNRYERPVSKYDLNKASKSRLLSPLKKHRSERQNLTSLSPSLATFLTPQLSKQHIEELASRDKVLCKRLNQLGGARRAQRGPSYAPDLTLDKYRVAQMEVTRGQRELMRLSEDVESPHVNPLKDELVQLRERFDVFFEKGGLHQVDLKALTKNKKP